MARRIPPMNPLRVFEVVARTQNLTLAAQELHVSQSAVSRQIATLESYLGVELFRRERHGVTLTRVGQGYAEEIVPAFDAVANATARLLRSTSQGALRVRTYTTFAAKWLIPRLPDFQRQYPSIEVRIDNATPDVDFDRDPADVAIQFGDGRWPRVVADHLFDDEMEPVCTPAYLEQHRGKRGKLEALLQHRLLVSHYRRRDWDDWLAFAGLESAAQRTERMSFNSSVLTWQAALDGLGIAIGQSAMLQAELDAGRLVRPFARPLRREMAYYLIRPRAQRESRKVGVFRDWLLETVGKTRSA
ncbi:transcriptional regulator GcvA [Cupriavidus plantarum]|uniref:transcriptional regulator GcvA n=1 Tax=Cupriavidus plantarum TaxID=942865 RepID=UPI001B23D377|nr:transcriptional regulator GcvA [Cupriavidus plantarum]CAG2137244.1 Glycine cleavage system transcriptional activator [Cupriavidus plantarum]SMR84883.1 transcriptional regulator, LysR family [Cupriavidus plantarum]